MSSDLVQVISGDGAFDQPALETLMAASSSSSSSSSSPAGWADVKNDYQVVAIMGPQSSGKSTLMNYLFGTSFQEMDALSGRRQTTKGVWVARSPKVPSPPTLVLDLEGSDGRERGEDDTNFERQSALFALAVADALLVNVWCHDIGREHGSGKPLLKTIFGVNLKLFSPAAAAPSSPSSAAGAENKPPPQSRRRPTLLFVIRDRSKTPLARLTEVLREDLDRIWLSLPKPVQARDKTVDDYFDVQYAALPHYEERHDEFCAEVDALRRRFSRAGGVWGGGGNGGYGDGAAAAAAGEGDLVPPGSSTSESRLPADAFAMSAAGIWSVIRAQKDLNLPAHKVMVAGVRCREIARDQLACFAEDQAWLSLESEARQSIVPDFGARLGALATSCLAGYDGEAAYFDAGPRAERRAELRERLAAAARPAFDAQMGLVAGERAIEFERALKLAAAEGRAFSEAARAARGEALRAFDRDARRACVGGGGAGGEGEGADDNDNDNAAAANNNAKGGGLLPSDLSPDQARETLASALDAHVDRLKRQRVKEALHAAQRRAANGVAVPAIELLSSFPPLLWPRLHAARDEALSSARESLALDLSGVELADDEAAQADARLAAAAEDKLSGLLREAALTTVARMRERFGASFSVDPQTRAPRSWRPRDDVPALAREARMATARVLAALAVRRGPDYVGGDAVERAVMAMAAADCGAASDAEAAAVSASAATAAAAASAATEGGAAAAADMVGSIQMAAMGAPSGAGGPPSTPAASLQGAPGTALKARAAAAATPGGGQQQQQQRLAPGSAGGAAFAAAGTPLAGGYDLATASAWPAGSVSSPDDVLITPAEARTAWRELMASSALAVQQALTAQQASAAANRRGAPAWALLAIALLGWNELVAVLWNPIYLVVGALLAAFGWQLYSELDVDAEMQRGLLPALISIGGRLLPTARSVAERSLASVVRLVAEGGQALAEHQHQHERRAERVEGEGDEAGEQAGGGGTAARRGGGGGGGGMGGANPSADGLRPRRQQQQQQQQYDAGADEMEVDAYDGKAD